MPFARKINRLPHKPLYQGNYWYFVTICVEKRRCIFGQIDNGKTILNPLGKIIENKINSLNQFYDLILDEFIIMPNHIHLIIGETNKSISKIIGGLKSFTFKEIKTIVEEGSCLPLELQNKDNNVPVNGDREVSATDTVNLINKHGTIWQKSFHDHIIRNQEDLQRIREYIQNNPYNWNEDELNPLKGN